MLILDVANKSWQTPYMTLAKSGTKQAREKNIKEMVASGHDPKQAVAAAYANQRRWKTKTRKQK